MKKLETEIIINAPAEKVWSILTDFGKFSEWNPFILSIEGKKEVGAQLKVVLKNGKGTSVFAPKVLVSEQNRTFEWLGSLPVPGLFNGQHKFHIETISDNQVKFIHNEQFSGLLAGLLMKMIGEETRKGFIAMNDALKKRAEQ
ncbi:MAG: SRPBCC domain-containing protein [Chitinophagales bacterium]|nr:SRPBCC domain-containing protein [Chitinophagales bacterium]